MTLNEKLKTCRINKGLSQEKVAELVGVSRQAVTKWENGQTIPSSDNLLELAAIYNMSIDELVSDKQQSKTIEIKRTNLTLTAIILQAAFMNAAMQPFQFLTIPSLKAFELAFKFIPLLAASVWMALNLRYEKNPAQYRKNTKTELLYCLVQLAILLFGHFSGRYFIATLLLLSVASFYILVINPKIMNRPLTRQPGKHTNK